MAVESIRGNLSTTGRLRANLAVGGGSEVTITPTYNSGTKIADYSIDGEEGILYIPSSTKKIDLLLDTPFSSGQSSLLHDIADYDELEIIYGFIDSSDNASLCMNVLTNYFINNCIYSGSPNNSLTHILFHPYNDSYNRLIMGDAPNKIYLFDAHNTQIKRVYGIKY